MSPAKKHGVRRFLRLLHRVHLDGASVFQSNVPGPLKVRCDLPSPGHGPREIDQSAQGDKHNYEGLPDGPGKYNIMWVKHCLSPQV